MGDCWFLSALSSLARVPGDAHYKVKKHTIDKVVQKHFNCSEGARNAGVFRFKVIFHFFIRTRSHAGSRPFDNSEFDHDGPWIHEL